MHEKEVNRNVDLGKCSGSLSLQLHKVTLRIAQNLKVDYVYTKRMSKPGTNDTLLCDLPH